MSAKTISTKKDLKKTLGKGAGGELVEAIASYLERGGVIRIVSKPLRNRELPKIVYPTKKTLEIKIREKKKVLELLQKEADELSKRLKKAELYEITANLKKFSEPVYRKHIAKYWLDEDYRNDADLVALPTHLVSDKRWKPLVEMFVSNTDYRKQLTEAVQTSVAYSEERKVARFAKKQQEFRKSECKRKLSDLNNKLQKISSELKNYNYLKRLI